MSLTDFLTSVHFTPYGSIRSSWDSYNAAGSVLMQLWHASSEPASDADAPGAYRKVCCFNALHHARGGQRAGYAGREKAIAAFETGARGYAVISVPPPDKVDKGEWAAHADLKKVYPILKLHRPGGSDDIFAIVGKPIAASDMV